jgi:hypothetical protein
MTKLSVENDMQSCLIEKFPFIFIVIKISGRSFIYMYIYPLSFALPFFVSKGHFNCYK